KDVPQIVFLSSDAVIGTARVRKSIESPSLGAQAPSVNIGHSRVSSVWTTADEREDCLAGRAAIHEFFHGLSGALTARNFDGTVMTRGDRAVQLREWFDDYFYRQAVKLKKSVEYRDKSVDEIVQMLRQEISPSLYGETDNDELIAELGSEWFGFGPID